jgi:DNA-directed RNA polymerase specialized sigma24 family protein
MLDEALRQVPEKYRVPLLLRYLEGKTQEQVAR